MQKYTINNLEMSEKVKEEFNIYSKLLGQLLFSRGIKTKLDAEKFLNPDYDRDTYDPFLMKDMDRAVDRIFSAIEKKEKILIYSDYDADGIPGAVVLHDFFKKIKYQNFKNYIPHRYKEGYGLNLEAIEKFSKENVNLIITIDCGITNVDEVAKANELGIDVIVTDHHIIGDILPSAYAILNPKQNDCNYPDDMIAGAGVIFKLVQALIQKGSDTGRSSGSEANGGGALGTSNDKFGATTTFDIPKGWDKWLLDMVGLATISDMVPLRNENRVFSYYGMKVLRKSPRHGLLHLLSKLKINQKTLTEDDIAFMITPRINAASRVDDPMRAFEFLSTEDETSAGELSNHLDSINSKRKIMVASMVKEANKKLKEREIDEVVVIGNPKWNPGVSGLVASSLVEKYNKPAFVWGGGVNDSIKGSCRSCGDINVVNLMKNTEDVFGDIGGHSMAGGFTIREGKIHFLEEKLNNAYKKVEKSGEKFSLVIDKKISLDEVNWENYNQIEKLAPFGMENQKPIFLVEDIEVFNTKVFGKQNNHLGLDFKNSKGQNISAIKFFAKEVENGVVKLNRGDKVNIIFNLEKSTFRNVNELRLRIVDIFGV